MKSIILSGINKMEVVDTKMPVIQHSNDVLIKMKKVGVCGSDMHYFRTGRIGSQIVKYPFVVGHEGTGIVVETGKDVKKVKPGDNIVIEPAVFCGVCDQCLNNRKNTCRNLKFLGCPGQLEGCLSEYIVMPETSCFPFDDTLSHDKAVLAEPLSIGIYSVEIANPAKNAKIAILGAGPIGLSILFALKNKGFNKIYMTDIIDSRVEYAHKAGAIWAGNPEKTNILKYILENEPLQLDIVFECCGKQEAAENAINLLKPGGKLIIVGIPEFDNWNFPADIIRRKELSIINIRRQNECLDKAIKALSEDKTNFEKMITHHFDFHFTASAFELVSNYKDGVIKAVIDF
jgi:L-iditol 2-dehydrogenase